MYQIKKHQGHTWHTKSGELVFWHLKQRVDIRLSEIAENWFAAGATIEATDEIMFITAKNGIELTYRVSRKGL